MKLSIIVPCFNVAPFVEKCLKSLVSQDIDKNEYEIIVLNDGSTDNTYNIIVNYAKSKKNIKVYTHENGGLSFTRNRGIREAKGDYIWFIDSDDWIKENCLSNIVSYLKENVDILAFNSFIPEGGRIENPVNFLDCVDSKESLLKYGFTDPVQFYVYRRDFLSENGLLFKEGIKHEDTLFTPIAIAKAEKMGFYRKPVYHFLQRSGSITQIVALSRVKNIVDNQSFLISYFATTDDNTRICMYNHIAHHILEMVVVGIENGTEGEIFLGEVLVDHPEFLEVLHNATDMKPKLFYWLLRLSPFNIGFTLRAICRIRNIMR